MNLVALDNGALRVEGVALADIAVRFGTPCYVYSRAALTAAFNAYRQAIDAQGLGSRTTVCYAVKANSNLAVLNLFARLGAGFDIVSGGELARVLAAGGDPAKVEFSGVGKSEAELSQALAAGIGCFNVESATELERLNGVAGRMGSRAPIAFRVNPDVDPKTHPYISTGLKSNKFGIPIEEALAHYRRAAALPNIRIKGIACHIGSQLVDPAPGAEATAKVIGLADALAAAGLPVQHIDLGGGMGIRYRDEPVLSATDYLAPMLRQFAHRQEQIFLEPGRSLVGNAGLLLTRAEVIKRGAEKNFVIVDAAMNDLARPALYDAWHDIVPVAPRPGAAEVFDVVGPVCESGDFLGLGRSLSVAEGDLLAVLSAGAYGMAMSSNYNTRPRSAEVMVDGDQVHLVREREQVPALFAGEHLLPV